MKEYNELLIGHTFSLQTTQRYSNGKQGTSNSPQYIENLTLCSQFVHLYTQVILAHVVHVHACFNAKLFLIAVLGWNF